MRLIDLYLVLPIVCSIKVRINVLNVHDLFPNYGTGVSKIQNLALVCDFIHY